MANGDNPNQINTAHISDTNPRKAAQKLYEALVRPDTRLVIFFCSNKYNLETLGNEINRLFAGIEVVGCTTAGEIGPAGYREHSLVGLSFPSGATWTVVGRLDRLQSFGMSQGRMFVERLFQDLEGKTNDISTSNSFAFLMVDGLSLSEEFIAYVLQSALGAIPLVGGSAGDGLSFSKTFVYYKGRFYQDSAVLVLFSTVLPFNVFKTQHFVPVGEPLVATDVNANERIVKEINGLPAAVEYARVTGIDRRSLTPTSFAASPVVVSLDGTHYVRAIQKVNPDDSLTFYCAISEGLIFRVAQSQNIMENLDQTLRELEETMGPLQLVLACDCILRKVEILLNRQRKEIEKIMLRYNVVGFNTYGEQYRSLHINQTLTGIAIGAKSGTRQ